MESSDIRDKLRQQRQMWMREREIYKDKEEIEQEQQQRPDNNQSSSLQQPEFIDKLFVKMSERLEQKYLNQGQIQNKQGQKVESALEMEETLHNQVMSNTCPICFELFLPPNNQPFILFPCGHTFCKICINSYAKSKNKCPFCRSTIKSMAPNISLQNLILSANEKKDEVIKKLKDKQDQMLKNNAFGMQAPINLQNSNNDNMIQGEKYLNDLKLLEIRCSVLEEEKADATKQIQDSKHQIQEKQKFLDTLANEKSDCLERLKKVQKELDLINNFQDKTENEIEQIKNNRSKQEQAIKYVDEALKPLIQEKQKAYAILQSIAPQLLNQLPTKF